MAKMQTTHTSTSHTQSQPNTQLLDAWIKQCPQCKDIRINGEKKMTKKEEDGEKKLDAVEIRQSRQVSKQFLKSWKCWFWEEIISWSSSGHS